MKEWCHNTANAYKYNQGFKFYTYATTAEYGPVPFPTHNILIEPAVKCFDFGPSQNGH